MRVWFGWKALLILGAIDAFPSSEAFDAINAALQADESERKVAMKQGNAVFAFILKNKAGETESWHIDLKTKGEVLRGTGDKPSGEPFLQLGLPLDRFQTASTYALEHWR